MHSQCNDNLYNLAKNMHIVNTQEHYGHDTLLHYTIYGKTSSSVVCLALVRADAHLHASRMLTDLTTS